jgi:hypothetical protein
MITKMARLQVSRMAWKLKDDGNYGALTVGAGLQLQWLQLFTHSLIYLNLHHFLAFNLPHAQQPFTIF